MIDSPSGSNVDGLEALMLDPYYKFDDLYHTLQLVWDRDGNEQAFDPVSRIDNYYMYMYMYVMHVMRQCNVQRVRARAAAKMT